MLNKKKTSSILKCRLLKWGDLLITSYETDVKCLQAYFSENIKKLNIILSDEHVYIVYMY